MTSGDMAPFEVRPLTLAESAELDQCNSVIENGLINFVEVGNALLTVRDKRLYRQEFKTFHDYCDGKWGISTRRAYQLITAAGVMGNLVNHGSHSLPTSERQCREIAKLHPEEQPKVWAEVIKSGEATAEKIKRTAAKGKATKPIPFDPFVPNVIAAKLLNGPITKKDDFQSSHELRRMWDSLDRMNRLNFMFGLFGQRCRRSVNRAIHRVAAVKPK